MPNKKENQVVVAETDDVVNESHVSDSDVTSDNEVTNDTTTDIVSDDSKKVRKSRKSKTSLTEVLALLRDHETKKAIAMLESYIKNNGDRSLTTTKKKRGEKRDDGELNPYQLFMRNKMKDIKDTNPGMAHNEIMKLAVAEWNVQKKA